MYANFPSRTLTDPAVAPDFDSQPLDAAAAKITLDAIHSNTRLARGLQAHLESDDPASRGLPAHRRDVLRERCAGIVENRSYEPEGRAPTTPQPAGMSKGVPLPITERHQVMAQKDREALEAITEELAAESRYQLTQSLAPLRQDLAALETAGRSLFPPLHLPFCPKVNRLLDQLAQVREDDVASLAVGPTVQIARKACAGFKHHLAAVETLGSLQHDLGLTRTSRGPGTACNQVMWLKACDALRAERWEDFKTLTAALARLAQPAPVLAPAARGQS